MAVSNTGDSSFPDLVVAICSIINAITQDEGFSLSEIGKNAQLCANKLLAWCKDREENRKAMCSFATELYSRLLQCTKHPRKVKCHTLRERMWERYYKLQISDEFTKLWTDFLRNTIGYKACPIFYQHVSNEMMKLVIKAEFPTDSCKSIESKVAPLDHEERNAFHYTAGYVIHAITKEVKRSSKDSILLSCLKEMSEGNEEDDLGVTLWTKSLDRGGLIHVKNVVFYCSR